MAKAWTDANATRFQIAFVMKDLEEMASGVIRSNSLILAAHPRPSQALQHPLPQPPPDVRRQLGLAWRFQRPRRDPSQLVVGRLRRSRESQVRRTARGVPKRDYIVGSADLPLFLGYFNKALADSTATSLLRLRGGAVVSSSSCSPSSSRVGMPAAAAAGIPVHRL